mgnify:CR=1 FL=1
MKVRVRISEISNGPMDTNYTATYLCDVFGYDYEASRTLLLEWLTWINPLILDTSSPD